MNPIIINDTVDLDKPVTTRKLSGDLFTGEAQAHAFSIAAIKDGAAVSLSGTVTGRFIRSNNTTILLSGSIVSGKTYVVLPQDCYNVPGHFDMVILVTESERTLCTYSLTGNVRRSHVGSLIDSGEVVPSLDDILEVYADVQAATTEAESAADSALSGVYAAEGVAKGYDGAIIPPCDDSQLDWALCTRKAGMLIELNGVNGTTNNRLCLYGTADKYSRNPTYADKPGWYGDPLTDFVVGHVYRFEAVLLSGTVTKTGDGAELYYKLCTAEGVNFLSGVGDVWEGGSTESPSSEWTCTFVPEMICFTIRDRTFDHAVIWLKITDLTKAKAIDPLSSDLTALTTRVGTAETDIDTIENRLDNYGLPSYYSTRAGSDPILSDWVAALNAQDVNNGRPGETVRFGFLTDVHISASESTYHNSLYSPGLMCAIRDMANVGLWFFGGDAITGNYATRAAAQVDLSYFRHVYKDIWPNMYCVVGNHDYGTNGTGSGVTANWDDACWVYNILQRDKERDYAAIHPPVETTVTTVTPTGYQTFGSYVIDCPAEKVRFICMSETFAGNFTQQKTWLQAQLNEKESGWTIIIINHRSVVTDNGSVIIDAKLTNSNSIMPVCTAYNTTGKATVACIIGGHCHFDYVLFSGGEHEPTQGVYSGTGIPVIAVTSDLNAKGSTTYTDRTTGTTKEQAFDVFQIDTKNRKIYITRIGGGDDRVIQYNAATNS